MSMMSLLKTILFLQIQRWWTILSSPSGSEYVSGGDGACLSSEEEGDGEGVLLSYNKGNF